MLNLSQQSQSDIPEGSSIRGSDSDIGEPEPDIGSEEDMDYNDTGRDTHEKDDKVDRDDKAPAPNNMLQMMNQIRSMIEMTVEKAKEDKNISSQKCKYFKQYLRANFPLVCPCFMNSVDSCYQAGMKI